MYQLHASAAKAGVDVLTRNLACEWGPAGVRVVGVAPGIIGQTEGFSRLGGSDAQGEQSNALTQAVPLGRLGHSDDIAAAVAFLCRSASALRLVRVSPQQCSAAPQQVTSPGTLWWSTARSGCTTAG